MPEVAELAAGAVEQVEAVEGADPQLAAAVLEAFKRQMQLTGRYCPRSREVRRGRFEITFDRDFAGVMRAMDGPTLRADLIAAVSVDATSGTIATVDRDLKPLSLTQIEEGLRRFLQFARDHQDMTFHLTPIGCGLAGHDMAQVWRLLRRHGLPKNVLLTSSWVMDHE